ncbi:MAG: methionine adenosyltransferase domain-containing protein [Acidimicrobiia bacterium]|nr:methionine adenosyltransferase domain-containing protein [Acidimicrobiia bacterium]
MTTRRHIAEDVLPGHPDRLADAVAEAVVDHAVGRDRDALVGVEVAVHRRVVFVTGRVASSPPAPVPWGELVDDVCASAGVAAAARPNRVETDVDEGPLDDDERGIRRFSDDQSITVGHAEGSEVTHYLPPGVHAAHTMRATLSRVRCAHDDRLLADGKVLVRLSEECGRFVWERCNVAVQHAEGVGFDELHTLLVPALGEAAASLDAALPGSAESWSREIVRINGLGDFTCGGTDGDNGLSGKKLAVDFYGPMTPLGGGAMCGKDPHKVDRAGALRARQLAVRLVRGGAVRTATVWLTWLPRPRGARLDHGARGRRGMGRGAHPPRGPGAGPLDRGDLL